MKEEGAFLSLWMHERNRGRVIVACGLALASAIALAGDPYGLKATEAEAEPPVRVFTNAAGRVVADFGQDAFGWLEIDAPTAGLGYFLNMGEILRKSGQVDRNPGQNIRARGVWWHTEKAGFQRVPVAPDLRNLFSANEGAPIRMPADFGVVTPFRAVEFYRADFPVTPQTVRRVVVRYPADRTESSFACDDERLVRVYDFCKHTMFATSFAGIFVDGDRERIPYEADAYAAQLNWYAVSSDYAYPRTSIEYLYDHPTWPTEFRQASILSAWADWMWTGDTRSLAKHYDTLKTKKLLLDYARPSDGLLVTGGERPSRGGCYTNRLGLADIVDWPRSERADFDFRDVNAVVNAFHVRTLEAMRDIADALGRTDDATDFAARAARARTSFARGFVDPATGLVLDGEGSRHSSVHANALALAHGLVPADREARVADWLAAQGMGCSVYFAQYLLEGLFRAGRADAAFARLTASDDRSWLGMLAQGATMTAEAWNLKVKPNMDVNHAWGATAINVISRFVLGVTPLEPGFRKISIAPQTGPLKKVSAVVPTQAGPVRIELDGGCLSVAAPAPAVVRWQGRIEEIPGDGVLREIAAAEGAGVAVPAPLPKVWMSYKPGKDEVAELKDMKAHGVEVVQFGCSGVAACRKHLKALRAAGLKFAFQVQDVTEYFSTVRLNGLEPEPAVMIGGVYDGKAIDRHVFAFDAAKHEIVIEPPVYNVGFPGRKGSNGLSGPKDGEPIGHYLPGTVPVKAEVVVALKPFDGCQHLKIVPAVLAEAPPGTKPRVDSVRNPKFFTTAEYRDRKLYRLSFDLSDCSGSLLDRVGLAVYWQMLPPPEGYPGFRGGMVSPAAESTRETARREVFRRAQMWADANGGTFPADLLAGVRFGDECFVTTGHLGGEAVSYPLWDYSAPAQTRFRRAAGPGVEPPRTWGRPDIYGADAYAVWQYAFHSACAELAGVVRDAVREIAPHVPVFRNTTRTTVFSLTNDHDGTGQELLARALDLVHLDPYPVHGPGWSGYTEAIPADMAYCGGLARRYGKPLMPWMQAHAYSRLTDPTPEQVRRMCAEQWAQGIDAVQWLGYGYTFPAKRPDSWAEAAQFHARLKGETSPKPTSELAVLRPYAVWALSNLEGTNALRNPADWMLQQFLLAWSVDGGRAYDVFEIPPHPTDAEKAELRATLARYRHVVSTQPYPGAKVIGANTEGTTVDVRTAATVRAAYLREIRDLKW